MAENTDVTITLLPGHSQVAVGKVEFDASSITAADYIEVDIGFKPKYVEFMNFTDRISAEYYEGMVADTCLKTAAAGTRTLETTNKGITLVDSGFRVAQNATLAVIAASKTCYFKAFA